MNSIKSTFLKSYAKLNLFLHVLNKRENGYHSIESIFVPISWHDEILIENTQDSVIRREGDIIGDLKNDLLNISAHALKNFMHKELRFSAHKIQSLGCKLVVKKNIPSGAGLGGGSSNAGVTLKALNKIWNLDLSVLELKMIGALLGADVPFFLQDKACFVSGIGEKLTNFFSDNFLPKYFVIVVPQVEVSTQAIFQSLELKKFSQSIGFSSSSRKKTKTLFSTNSDKIWTFGKNDIENSTCNRYPAVKYALNLLKEHAKANDLPELACRLSGTGGAVFCSTPTLVIAKRIESQIKKNSKVKLLVKVCKRILSQ